MKTYAVVTETLQRTVYIDAKSAEEIVLDSSGYQGTEIEVVEDDN